MYKLYAFLAAVFVLFFAFTSAAFTPPTPNGFVTDMAGKLSVQEKQNLETKLSDINKNSKNELAALILPTLDGESIENVANDTFKSWKIGKKDLDNGVLVVIAVAEHKARIETGKGVEGELTDLQASTIIRTVLAPQLKRGNFYQGLNDTFNSINSSMEPRTTTVVPPSTVSGSGSAASFGEIFVLVLLLIGGAFFVSVFLIAKASRKRNKRMQKIWDEKPDYLPFTGISSYSSHSKHSTKAPSSSSHTSPSYSDSSYGSGSSYDSGSSGGGSDGGGFGGFGGGDSGGGGASGDW